jgi:hypothetical protein
MRSSAILSRNVASGCLGCDNPSHCGATAGHWPPTMRVEEKEKATRYPLAKAVRNPKATLAFGTLTAWTAAERTSHCRSSLPVGP